MTALRALMFVIGLVALAFGLLFIGQGLGVVRWPARSSMIDERTWVIKGAAVAVIGLVLLWLNRPRR